VLHNGLQAARLEGRTMIRVTGMVMKAEVHTYTDKNGEPASVFRAQIGDPENPQRRWQAVSGPVELLPEVADFVDYRVSLFPKGGANGPWVSVWCAERVGASVGA